MRGKSDVDEEALGTSRHRIDVCFFCTTASNFVTLWRCFIVVAEMGTCSSLADANFTVILLPGIVYQGLTETGGLWSVRPKYLWIRSEVEVHFQVVGFALRDSCMCELLLDTQQQGKAKP
ncbi:hypothetical protein CGCTS75_v012106 [Colletotrichum tropicale]|nr:hypothetical protein CGCTS75_v012106 [Colletotrichum tropicale]